MKNGDRIEYHVDSEFYSLFRHIFNMWKEEFYSIENITIVTEWNDKEGNVTRTDRLQRDRVVKIVNEANEKFLENIGIEFEFEVAMTEKEGQECVDFIRVKYVKIHDVDKLLQWRMSNT